MRHSYKILAAKEDRIIADGTDQIDVKVQIFLDGEPKEIKSFGYPMTHTAIEIKADLDKCVTTMDLDAEKALASKEEDAVRDAAKATIADLINES